MTALTSVIHFAVFLANLF